MDPSSARQPAGNQHSARWQHVRQLAIGAIHQEQSVEARAGLLDRIDWAK